MTHRFEFQQSLNAYEAAAKGLGVKIMIHCKKRSDSMNWLIEENWNKTKIWNKLFNKHKYKYNTI